MTMPTLETRILWELSTINLEGLDVWLYCYYTHIHATRRSRNELTLHVYKDRSDVETAVTAMMEPPPVQQKKKNGERVCVVLYFLFVVLVCRLLLVLMSSLIFVSCHVSEPNVQRAVLHLFRVRRKRERYQVS